MSFFLSFRVFPVSEDLLSSRLESAEEEDVDVGVVCGAGCGVFEAGSCSGAVFGVDATLAKDGVAVSDGDCAVDVAVGVADGADCGAAVGVADGVTDGVADGVADGAGSSGFGVGGCCKM